MSFEPSPSEVSFCLCLNEEPRGDFPETVRNQGEQEGVFAGKREVFVHSREKRIGRSRLRIPSVEVGTARNMNTMAWTAELARGME